MGKLRGPPAPLELEALLAELRVEGIAIEELRLAETDLEQVFLRVMQDDAMAHASR